MRETKCYKAVKRAEAICLVMILLLVSFVPSTVQAATTDIQSVEKIDFADFSNWRSGVYYHTNGKYVENINRLCLKNYVTFTSEKFKAHITDNAFRILIRELNYNKNFIKSVTLANGQTYEPGENTVYLAISIYKFANGEKEMSYEVFENKFANGFVAELCTVQNTTSSGTAGTTTDTTINGTENNTITGTTIDKTEQDSIEKTEEEELKKKTVEEIEFKDFSNWRTGYYHYSTGKYTSYPSRICLNDYVTFENDEYVVSISMNGYQVLIRELDENMKFIKSYTLSNGKIYTPSSTAKYLGISVYKQAESGVTYTTFKDLFNNGFETALIPSEEYAKNQETVEVPSTGTTKKETVYEVLEEMIVTGDSSVKDISSYKVTTWNFCYNICPKIENNLKIEMKSYFDLSIEYSTNGWYVTKCWLEGVDEGARERIPKVRKSVEEVLTKVDTNMSDMEKVLLVHEYLIRKTTYKYDDDGLCYSAGGPLGNGAGVCAGYARAMILLLEEMDIEAYYARSTSMNHAWVYVKLDGAWYHIDPTWDDTRMGTNGMYVHRFFIRNDEEFGTTLTGNLHYGWKVNEVNTASASNKYTDWYVHDVAGLMHYYNGMWYYWDKDTNSIVCSNIEGTIKNVIIDGTNCDKLRILDITGNTMSYYVGSRQYTKNL